MQNLLEFLKKDCKNRQQFFYSIKNKIKKDEKIGQIISNITKFLDDNYYSVTLDQRILHLWENHFEIYVCPICGNGRKIDSSGKYYLETCGNKECVKILKKNKFLNKYGVENPSQLNSVKEKKKQTTLKNYGVENPFMDKILRTQSFINKYGVENPSQLNSVKEKKKQTTFKNYGVENPFQLDDVKEKANKNRNTIESKNKKSKSMKSTLYYKNKEKFLHNLKNLNLKLINCNDGYHIQLKCNKCGLIFNINKQLFNNRMNHKEIVCTLCNPKIKRVSEGETEVSEFIESLGFTTENSNRTLLNGMEIDILIPEKKIGFEFNGTYWHSSLFKDENYHINKKKLAFEKGIDLFFIWEHEWYDNKEEMKEIIEEILIMDKTKYKNVSSDLSYMDNDTILISEKCNYKNTTFFRTKVLPSTGSEIVNLEN